MSDIQKVLKILQELKRQVDSIESKINEFEIIFDAADIIEEHREEEENKYSTEWNPYEDEDFSKGYNGYYEDDEDDDLPRGY